MVRDLKHLEAPSTLSRWMRLRVGLLGLGFLGLLVGVLARAVELQVRQTDRLKAFAQDQYVRDLEIPARRGDILDRRRVPLAQSVDVDSVWVDPSLLPAPATTARVLARALGVDPHELLERFGKGRRFAWVKRQVTPTEVARVKALEVPGLGLAREPRRFYPQRELAAHLIGLVGTDAHGLDGLEKSFEDELSGDVVRRMGFRDARGRKLLPDGVDDTRSRQGASVQLTIDRQLQYVTERALEKAVLEARAVAGTAVMLDPRTGEVLALANAPHFNPNTPAEANPEALRNRGVTDAFEPGSTMKAFVVASALDQGVVTEDTGIQCEGGAWTIGKHVIHDTHPHGVLRVKDILQVSSNIGAAKVAQRLGRERLQSTFEHFGFGERTTLGLPGEGKGVVPPARAEVVLATQAFGQGLTATAVQVASAYGALANGGVLMRPYLVSRVVDPDGVVLLENQPTPVRRVVGEKAARAVVAMLEGVVEPQGTAPRARMAEYRVAGKTGTAQKADPVAGGYSDRRIASFVGLLPAEDPRVVILVVIDEPRTDVYGGLVAAPAFREIASQAMATLGVPPSRGVPLTVPLQANGKESEPPSRSPLVAAIERAQDMDVVTEQVADGAVRVPDLLGSSGRVAVGSLLTVALEPHLSGSGRVVTQRPSAGTLVERGTRVSLELASRLPAPR
jgi:cell division protein FtsI (penicillin-binding protein 3)